MNTRTEEFLGFAFNGQHSSDFNLVVVSDGSRYHLPLFGTFTDVSLKVPGKNGTYYFGSEFESKTLSLNLAFDNLTAEKFIRMQNWLSYQNLGQLILNETPYKYYYAKIASQPTIDFVPFDTTYTLANATIPVVLYKGEINLEFIAYEPFSYNTNLNIDSYFSGNSINLPIWFLESGMIPTTYHHDGILFNGDTLNSLNASTNFYVFNGGNITTDSIFSFDVVPFVSNLEITNLYDNDKIIITPFATSIFTLDEDIIPLGESETVTDIRITIDGAAKKITAVGKNVEGSIITTGYNLGKYHNAHFLKIYSLDNIKMIKLNKDASTDFDMMSSYETSNLFPSDYSGSSSITLPDYSNYFCSTLVDCKLLSDYITYIENNTPQSEEINKISFLMKPNGFICNKALENLHISYNYKYL